MIAGYIIRDKYSGAIDWDGEVHATIEAAIESMCGDRQMFSRTRDFNPDEKTGPWFDVYDICPVLAGITNTEEQAA